MDMFPTVSTRSGDSTTRDNDVYREIQVNPASLSANPTPVVPSPRRDEEESEPEEAPASEDDGVQPMAEDNSSYNHALFEDGQADPIPEDLAADDMPTDFATVNAIRSPTSPGAIRHYPRADAPRVMRTARKHVRLPQHPYASTSRAHTLASPPQITPSLDHAIAHLDSIPSPNPSTPASSSARAASSIAPAQDTPASPVSSPFHADPTLDYVLQHLTSTEIEVFRIKEILSELPGPDNFEDLEKHLKEELKDLRKDVNFILGRLSMADHRIYETHMQIFAPGGLSDQYQRLQIMRNEDRMENRRLRRRINDLEEAMDAMRIR